MMKFFSPNFDVGDEQTIYTKRREAQTDAENPWKLQQRQETELSSNIETSKTTAGFASKVADDIASGFVPSGLSEC